MTKRFQLNYFSNEALLAQTLHLIMAFIIYVVKIENNNSLYENYYFLIFFTIIIFINIYFSIKFSKRSIIKNYHNEIDLANDLKIFRRMMYPPIYFSPYTSYHINYLLKIAKETLKKSNIGIFNSNDMEQLLLLPMRNFKLIFIKIIMLMLGLLMLSSFFNDLEKTSGAVGILLETQLGYFFLVYAGFIGAREVLSDFLFFVFCFFIKKEVNHGN